MNTTHAHRHTTDTLHRVGVGASASSYVRTDTLAISNQVSSARTSLSLFRARSTRATCWSTCLRDKDMTAASYWVIAERGASAAVRRCLEETLCGSWLARNEANAAARSLP